MPYTKVSFSSGYRSRSLSHPKSSRCSGAGDGTLGKGDQSHELGRVKVKRQLYIIERVVSQDCDAYARQIYSTSLQETSYYIMYGSSDDHFNHARMQGRNVDMLVVSSIIHYTSVLYKQEVDILIDTYEPADVECLQ